VVSEVEMEALPLEEARWAEEITGRLLVEDGVWFLELDAALDDNDLVGEHVP
jgi:hypothetical protein